MADITSVFSEVLLDSDCIWALRDFMPRGLTAPFVPGKATVFVGVRRSGKTTVMRELAQSLKHESAISQDQILFINFSDERLRGINSEHLSLLIEAHYRNKSNCPKDSGLFFFLDEIQLVEGWELFVDRILRDKKNRVYISGSSAKLLSTEIATELRGRAITVEIFPFSFAEYLKYQGIEPSLATAADRGVVDKHLRTYLTSGGFPEIQKLEPPLQRQIIQEYLNVLLYRDVIERHNPRNPHAIRLLLDLALEGTAAPRTFTKTASRLKSNGIPASPGDVGEYFSWLEDCYAVWLIPVLSESQHRKNTNPKKTYCVDNGFVSATTTGLSEKTGTLLENLVFQGLRRKTKDIYYFKSKAGYEVDFVIKDPSNNQWQAMQVAASLKDEATKARELRALTIACSELNLKNAQIITLTEDATLTEDTVNIEVRSVARFLLEQ